MGLANHVIPRGSIYTTIKELDPNIPYYRRNYYGSQFPNSCICGPSGILCQLIQLRKDRYLCGGSDCFLGLIQRSGCTVLFFFGGGGCGGGLGVSTN